MATAPLTSFGRVVRRARRSIGPAEAVALLKSGRAGRGSLLGHGNGRSYGDTCLNDGGMLADMRSANRILALDADAATITVEAGALLRDVIRAARPHGLFPPVVPGTELVTVGGAVANDIHGKNHHRRGTFGRHIAEFTLMRSDGSLRTCSPERDPALFGATIGGMGLTGLILTVTMRLMRVASVDIVETVTAFSCLDEYFDRCDAADDAHEYSVAWIDQLARGRHGGRGLLMTGDHAETDAPAGGLPFRPRVPFAPPVSPLNRPGLTLFNAFYRTMKGRAPGPHSARCQSFFFPLDAVEDWNLLYGPAGLHQHQSVVPVDAARRIVPLLLSAARESGQASFLTVLKRFGDIGSPGLLSFPRGGFTLTLDFPNRGERTLGLLSRLDAITMDAGGAVNPYKDSRMPADVFRQSFPRWAELERVRDPAFISDFWHRVGTVPAQLMAAE